MLLLLLLFFSANENTFDTSTHTKRKFYSISEQCWDSKTFQQETINIEIYVFQKICVWPIKSVCWKYCKNVFVIVCIFMQISLSCFLLFRSIVFLFCKLLYCLLKVSFLRFAFSPAAIRSGSWLWKEGDQSFLCIIILHFVCVLCFALCLVLYLSFEFPFNVVWISCCTNVYCCAVRFSWVRKRNRIKKDKQKKFLTGQSYAHWKMCAYRPVLVSCTVPRHSAGFQ